MYALLTGRPPLEGKTAVETMIKIRQDVPIKPKKFQLAIPDRFEGVILQLLAKFEKNLRSRLPARAAERVLEVCGDQQRLERLPVDEFVGLFVV